MLDRVEEAIVESLLFRETQKSDFGVKIFERGRYLGRVTYSYLVWRAYRTDTDYQEFNSGIDAVDWLIYGEKE